MTNTFRQGLLETDLANKLILSAMLLLSTTLACHETENFLESDQAVDGFENQSLDINDDLGRAPNDQFLSSLDDMLTTDDRIDFNLETSLTAALGLTTQRCLGPWMCREGLGCHQGLCGGCQSTEECPQGLACGEVDADTGLGQCNVCVEINGEDRCSEGDHCIDGVCLPIELTYYRVDVEVDAWQNLSRNRYNHALKASCVLQKAELSTPDEEPVFESSHACEIKVHGGSSRDLTKLSWRLSFDDPIDGITWGDERMILRAEYNDLSLLRNGLSLTLFEQWTTIPTPRWRHVWLNVNGRDLGLYVQIEKNHDQMMRRWGRSVSAPRYEADQNIGDNLLTGASALVALPNFTDYWKAYKLSSGVSYTPLVKFIEEVLGSMNRQEWLDSPQVAALSQHVYWGSYIQYVAVMRLVQNLDSIRKNYVISFQSLGDGKPRWEVYPWDLDLSWGCLYNDQLGTSICDEIIYDTPLTLGEVLSGAVPSYPTDGLYNLLTERTLSPELAKTYYQERLCELARPLDQNPTLTQLFRFLDAYRTRLLPWVATDESYRGESFEVFTDSVEQIKLFWESRRQIINGQFSCIE